MNTQNARVFLAIAETGSLSAAAEKLYYSQPTITSSLNQLEKELGMKLVSRRQGVRNITLTDAGRAFLPVAKRIADIDIVVNKFKQSQSISCIRIAAGASPQEYMVADIIRRLKESLPDIMIQPYSAPQKQIPDGLATCTYDAGFYTTHSEDSTVPSIPIFEEGYCILCPANTVLPDRLLTAADLDPSFEVANVYSTAQPSGVTEWRRRHLPVDASPFMRPSMISSVENYLTDPRCWAILPTVAAAYMSERRQSHPQIRYIDSLSARRTFYMGYSETYPNRAVLDCLLACTKDFIAERPYLKCLL